MGLSDHPFDLLVQRSEGEIRLAEAALLFSADHVPGLEVPAWLERMDALKERVASRTPETAAQQVQALREVLIDEEGFLGDTEDYYNPQNSLLSEVLTRRRGIPISLSAIWIDIADQLGWPIHGVGFPMHFMVKCDGGSEEVYIDPFQGGRLFNRAGCQQLIARLTGQEFVLADSHFRAATTKEILTRMLNNLLGVYTREAEWPPALQVVRRILALHPEDEGMWTTMETIQGKLATLN